MSATPINGTGAVLLNFTISLAILNYASCKSASSGICASYVQAAALCTIELQIMQFESGNLNLKSLRAKTINNEDCDLPFLKHLYYPTILLNAK